MPTVPLGVSSEVPAIRHDVQHQVPSGEMRRDHIRGPVRMILAILHGLTR